MPSAVDLPYGSKARAGVPFLFWWLVSQKRALPVAALPIAFYQNNAQLERTACRPQSISRTGQRHACACLFFFGSSFRRNEPFRRGARGRPMVAPTLCTLYFRNHQKGSLVQRELARERLRDCFAETFCFADGRGRSSRPDVKLLFSFRHQIPHPLFL